MQDISESSHFTKVVFCGDSTVGKSTLLQRVVDGDVRSVQSSTMGAAYYCSRHTHEGEEISINLWDTAGQEEYRSLVNIYFRAADIAVVVFDLSVPRTLESVEDWIDEVTENAGPCAPDFIVVGNKSDLECRVSTDALAAVRAKYRYAQTSAKDGSDVDALVRMIVEIAFQRKREKTEDAVDIGERNEDRIEENRKDKNCC